MWRADPRLLAALAAHEPEATPPLAELLTHGLAPWRCRAWTVGDRSGLRGVLVATRLAFDEWHAVVFLADRSAAPALAAALDRGPARTVSGSPADVLALREYSRRALDAVGQPLVAAVHPVAIMGPADASTRLATTADLDALTELYAGYEWLPMPTRRQVRQYVRRCLRTGLVVVGEHGGDVVAAALLPTRTTRWILVEALTVRPDHRRSGMGWAVAARAQAVINGCGAGMRFTMAPSNPMPLDRHFAAEAWAGLPLVAARRFPGQGRLRALHDRIGARSARPPELFRDLPSVEG